MNREELEQLSLRELKELHKTVGKVIEDYEERKRAEAMAAAEAAAVEKGYSLSDLFGSRGAKKVRTVNPPKYQNPNNKAQTWTGKGRQPSWVKAALEDGKSLDDLAIT